MMMMMMMDESGNPKRRYQECCSTSTWPADYGGAMASKRPNSGSGPTSLSPKEKKDRIGERVTALQQLVSPFGKTDTASVLQDASSYIRFLHEQLHLLCAPYLHMMPMAAATEGAEYYSLRSRGLCLVPVSMSRGIARSNGADLWAPVNDTSKHS